MDRQPPPQKFIFCVHVISTKLFVPIKLLGGKVPLFYYIVGNTQSDPKCYQNIAFFLKTSKIKIKTTNTPLEDISRSQKSHCMQLANLRIIAENFRSIAQLKLEIFPAQDVYRAKNVKVEKTIFRQNLEKCGKIAKFVHCFKNYVLIATIEENTSKLFFRYITTLRTIFPYLKQSIRQKITYSTSKPFTKVNKALNGVFWPKIEIVGNFTFFPTVKTGTSQHVLFLRYVRLKTLLQQFMKRQHIQPLKLH